MKTIVKADLLKAMEHILNEYKEKTHLTTVSDCALCDIFHLHRRWNDIIGHECQDCPMFIFKLDHFYPCMNRRCEPVECTDKFQPIKLRAVKEYYRKIIAKVQETSEEDLNKENAFQFLMDIDNEVADKYNIGMRIKAKRSQPKVPADEY